MSQNQFPNDPLDVTKSPRLPFISFGDQAAPVVGQAPAQGGPQVSVPSGISSIHMHLRHREESTDASTYEFLALGQKPLIALIPGVDGEGEMLDLDVTGLSPDLARDLLAAAANSLNEMIEAGQFARVGDGHTH